PSGRIRLRTVKSLAPWKVAEVPAGWNSMGAPPAALSSGRQLMIALGALTVTVVWPGMPSLTVTPGVEEITPPWKDCAAAGPCATAAAIAAIALEERSGRRGRDAFG